MVNRGGGKGFLGCLRVYLYNYAREKKITDMVLLFLDDGPINIEKHMAFGIKFHGHIK